MYIYLSFYFKLNKKNCILLANSN